MDLKRNY